MGCSGFSRAAKLKRDSHAIAAVQVLSVRECVRITDAGLAAVAGNGGLEELDCSLVPAAGAATAVALTTCCKCAHSSLHFTILASPSFTSPSFWSKICVPWLQN